MIRLTLALLATLFLTFVIAGADRGQVRYGLMANAAAPASVQPAAIAATDSTVALADPAPSVAAPAPDEAINAVYVPVETLITQPQPEADLTEATAEPAAPMAQPERLVMFVAVNSANVREGPSKDFAVIEKLSRGEAVTVVAASDGPEGWTLIRIEGDGVEGYVSSALLADQP